MAKINNILDLPEEVLRLIIRQVPRSDNRSISECCKVFHEINCDVSFYALDIVLFSPDRLHDFLDNETTFNSLMSRRRRYDRFHIFGSSSHTTTVLTQLKKERLMKFVAKFGQDVKELTISDDFFNEGIVQSLLNLMPNLKKIFLFFVRSFQDEESDILLNLQKLEELHSMNYALIHLDIFKIFKKLPSGVLLKLKIINRSGEAFEDNVKLFENQHNIKDIELEGSFNYNNLNFKQLRLKSLVHCCRDKSFYDIKKILEGQRLITKFTFQCSMKSGDLKLISNEFESLEELDITNVYRFEASEFADLSTLKNLKVLKMRFGYQEEYSTIEGNNGDFNMRIRLAKCKNLIELKIECRYCTLTEATLALLSKNMPNLMKVHLESKPSPGELFSIVQYFPRLEYLEHHTSAYFYSWDTGKISLDFRTATTNKKFSQCLNILKGDKVTELSLTCCSLSESDVKILEQNLPQLTQLDLESESKECELGFVIKYLSKLESLTFINCESDCKVDISTFENLTDNSLKKLSIRYFKYHEDLAKIIGCCKKLDELMIAYVDSFQEIKEILIAQPNLKSLTVISRNNFSLKFAKVFKKYGKNLTFLKFSEPHINLLAFSLGVRKKLVKHQLKSLFDVFEFELDHCTYQYRSINNYASYDWIMRRQELM